MIAGAEDGVNRLEKIRSGRLKGFDNLRRKLADAAGAEGEDKVTRAGLGDYGRDSSGKVGSKGNGRTGNVRDEALCCDAGDGLLAGGVDR